MIERRSPRGRKERYNPNSILSCPHRCMIAVDCPETRLSEQMRGERKHDSLHTPSQVNHTVFQPPLLVDNAPPMSPSLVPLHFASPPNFASPPQPSSSKTATKNTQLVRDRFHGGGGARPLRQHHLGQPPPTVQGRVQAGRESQGSGVLGRASDQRLRPCGEKEGI